MVAEAVTGGWKGGRGGGGDNKTVDGRTKVVGPVRTVTLKGGGRGA